MRMILLEDRVPREEADKNYPTFHRIPSQPWTPERVAGLARTPRAETRGMVAKGRDSSSVK